MAPAESFEDAKRAGDAAVKAGDYAAAAEHYSAALELPGGGPQRAAVLCNRAFARLQRKEWKLAAEDATEVLAAGPEEKLRVKALFRRGLAREELGELAGADTDLNLALKSAPGNEGIVAAAKRVRAALPPKEAPPAWVPGQPYTTTAVLKLAGAVPGCLRGYLGMNEHPCARFACGIGVQAYERVGGLFAIRQALGPPQKAPEDVTVVTNERDYHDRPNFDPEDGVNIEYDRGGNLKTIYQQLNEDLNGPWAAFNADGSMNLRETYCYKNGRVVSKLRSDVPDAFMAHVLRALVVPVKKALGMGLSPGEEELCSQYHVNPDTVEPAALSVPHGLDRKPRLEPFEFKQAEPARSYGYGATWEDLLNAAPQCELGPAWVGPAPGAAPARDHLQGAQAAAAPQPAQTSSRRPDAAAPPELLALQGVWVDEATDGPVGRVEGATVVWHRSFHCRPTRLRLAADGGVLMELEGKEYRAAVERGPRCRLRWSDGDVWIRVSTAGGGSQ